jgi:hypothetical protein
MRALVVELLAGKVAMFHFAEHFLFRCAPLATDVACGFADRLHDYPFAGEFWKSRRFSDFGALKLYVL